MPIFEVSPNVAVGSSMITTIIPTFERPQLLRRAVLSVLDQDVAGMSVWLYDNASTDSTPVVAEELCRLDPRVHYHRHDENIGSIANFNFALARVDTPYFSLLSDDDLLLGGFYGAAIEELEAAPAAGFWCGRTVLHDPHSSATRAIANWPSGFYSAGEESMVRMIRAHYPWNGVLWRRQILDSVNTLDCYGSDDNFIVRAAYFNDFLVSDKLAAVLFHHEGGWTGRMLRRADESDSAGVSEYLGHVIGRPLELTRELTTDTRISSHAKAAAREALQAELQSDLLAYLVDVALPLGRDREIATICSVLRESSAYSPAALSTAAAEASMRFSWSRPAVRRSATFLSNHRKRRKRRLGDPRLDQAREAIERLNAKSLVRLPPNLGHEI